MAVSSRCEIDINIFLLFFSGGGGPPKGSEPDILSPNPLTVHSLPSLFRYQWSLYILLFSFVFPKCHLCLRLIPNLFVLCSSFFTLPEPKQRVDLRRSQSAYSQFLVVVVHIKFDFYEKTLLYSWFMILLCYWFILLYFATTSWNFT